MKSIILALLASLVWSSNVSAQTSFFEGKTVRILVGFSPGGAYDVWARVIAQYMGKYIPGNPAFVVQNMTGGGSMVAANHVYNVAKPDGLTFGLVTPALLLSSLPGEKRFSLTGLSSAGSVHRRRQTESFIFAQTPASRRSKTCARRRSRPSAVPRESAPRVLIGLSFLPTLLVSS